mgnify:CR=1 FL=1
MAENAALVEIDGLRVRFPGAARDAIRDLALSILPGECVAVIGPSGSGKSTLALALVGAIPNLINAESTGTIRWLNAATQPPVTAGSGLAALVMQDADAQLATLTVEDEVAFALENRDFPANEIEQRIDEALASAPAHGLQRRESTLMLSAGWRQRLALASALAERPALLVIDEPTAHLDEQGAQAAIAAIRAAKAQGSACLLVEHRADLAASIADRIVALDATGTIIAEGSPDKALQDLAARPDASSLRLPPDRKSVV